MSDVPQKIRQVFADNDSPDDARVLLKRVETHFNRGGSDGGSGGDGMEPRVAKLEASVAHIERDVTELRTDMRDVRDRLSRIETRVDHLPSKGFVVSSVILTLAILTAVITFQDRIQQFVRQPLASVQSPTSQPGSP
ncbi:hypothetical protein VSX64_15250 [Aurantimonas sp. C2-6-R+9]|uniref:hypothetical protein n=1 Tax=unclassified Aurantimonas TaxID=2638230 RepID=UPI002E19D594|nr:MULTISPECIES: hypothetical protein [unclassified Aurantimonas]MEC5292094.1 hypothetical protein [Aurantimonas sp. C2-3-R2]MEC5382225.1 hypothetical protein [Aurantimonas sp. C2-6-R+9]MEC5413180.1 hypothetical protein [Aurantimonas sp. C2-4-R8]